MFCREQVVGELTVVDDCSLGLGQTNHSEPAGDGTRADMPQRQGSFLRHQEAWQHQSSFFPQTEQMSSWLSEPGRVGRHSVW